VKEPRIADSSATSPVGGSLHKFLEVQTSGAFESGKRRVCNGLIILNDLMIFFSHPRILLHELPRCSVFSGHKRIQLPEILWDRNRYDPLTCHKAIVGDEAATGEA